MVNSDLNFILYKVLMAQLSPALSGSGTADNKKSGGVSPAA